MLRQKGFIMANVPLVPGQLADRKLQVSITAEEDAYISSLARERNRSRSYVARELLLPGLEAVMGRHGTPVLGTIPAGPLAEAIQQADGFVDCGTVLATKPDDFLLRVKGDSMQCTGDGSIEDGDLVLIRPGVQPNNGEICAVLVGDDSALKKLVFTPGRKEVRLRSANPMYEDRVVSARNVRVIGVYRGLVRRSRLSAS
jgi:repressor LexA